MNLKLVIFFICYSLCSFSQNDVYYVKDTQNSYDKNTITQAEFQLAKEEILEKYSETPIYWFKIPAHKTNSDYVFRIAYERIKEADVYQNNHKLKKLENERYLSYQFNRKSDVYVKVKLKLHSYIPFQLQEADKSYLIEKNELILNGFYYGFTFLIIIYNFCYFLMFRDDAFLYYSLFLASMGFGVFIMDGMLDFYNFSASFIDFCMIVNYCFLAFYSSKFANSYLLLDDYYPKLKRFSYALGSVIILLGILYLVQEKNGYFILLFINLLVFTLLFAYWFSAVLLFKKNIYIKILVFAYIIILFSGIDFFVFKFFGISIGNINPTNIKIGAFIEMIILSIAVLYRMNTIKEENEFMKQEIITYSNLLKNKNEKNPTHKVAENIKNLSLREREIFDLILMGKSNKEIASSVNISINTVKFHIKNIYEKLHIKNRKEAHNLAVKSL